MRLRDRIGLNQKAVAPAAPERDTTPVSAAAARRWTPVDRAYQELKLRIGVVCRKRLGRTSRNLF